MLLLLLRHGKAEDNQPLDGTDFDRALTEKGIDQSRCAARLLRSADLLPEIVLSSPLVRTRQTAEHFTQEASIPGPIIQKWLACGMTPQTAISELAAFTDFKKIMIVGHEPDFSHLIQFTIGARGESIDVRKGSISCLEINPPSPRAILRFLLPYKLGKHQE